ncbi:MAG: hypothetical protein GY752_00350 [bacterium]|nr:hypothetical protein [bacterium]MCP4798761.1 hypothetical protein [bacterium]
MKTLLFVLLACSVSAADAPLDSLIWVSEEAASDSLSSFWDSLDSDWYEPLTPEEIGMGLTDAEYDSVLTESNLMIHRIRYNNPWRFRMRKLARVGFNRVEGFHPGSSWLLTRRGQRQPEFNLGASYGIASHKVMWDLKADVPLKTARPVDENGIATKYPWTSLAFVTEAGRHTANFGGLEREVYNFTSMLYGVDPNSYYEADYWASALAYSPHRNVRLKFGGGIGKNDSMPVATRWSLFGDESDVSDNLQVAGLRYRDLFTQLDWKFNKLSLSGKASWKRVSDYPDRDPYWIRQFNLSGKYLHMDRFGNEIELRAKSQSMDRTAPMEWKFMLGDYGSLRGYEGIELAGDKGAFASIDFRFGNDPLAKIGLPIFDALSLQPVLFFDSGWVDDISTPTEFGGTGWRHNAGFGLSKYFALPGLFERITVYAARPVGENSQDQPWRFVVGFN